MKTGMAIATNDEAGLVAGREALGYESFDQAEYIDILFPRLG